MTHLPIRPSLPAQEPRTSRRDASHNPPSHNPWAAPQRGTWPRLVTWLRDAAERRRSRRLLAELDGRQLSDIGVSRGDALIEARKPFWRL